MQPKYYCSACNYQAKQSSHYEKHLLTLKHKKLSKSYPKVTLSYHSVISNLPLEKTSKHQCKYCDKTFNFASGVSRHIKYSCKKNNDEDIKELARLLNLQQKENKAMQKQNNAMQKQINQLTKKLQILNINNTHNTNMKNSHNIENIQNTIIGQQNFYLNNHKDTDYDFLTDNDYLKCMRDNNHCVKKLIETVHFNPKKPENMNIYISSHKGKHILVYKDDTWQIKNKKNEVDNLYEMNEISLENWYDENKDKYPDFVKSFERYLHNKENDNTLIRNVKDEIIQMLYNKRNMIKETSSPQVHESTPIS
jgi:hypothetical protein